MSHERQVSNGNGNHGNGDDDAYFIREYETKTNLLLRINQIEIGDVGCVVWDASIVLAKYLENLILDKKLALHDKRLKCIELGAGTGLIGILLAAYGAQNVVLTDLGEIQPLLVKNVVENRELVRDRVTCTELNWSSCKEFTKHDFIFIADCIYYEESVEPLVRCLVSLSHTNTITYCSYEERDLGVVPEVQQRFLNLANEHFHVERVDSSDLDEFYKSDDIIVLKMKLK